MIFFFVCVLLCCTDELWSKHASNARFWLLCTIVFDLYIYCNIECWCCCWYFVIVFLCFIFIFIFILWNWVYCCLLPTAHCTLNERKSDEDIWYSWNSLLWKCCKIYEHFYLLVLIWCWSDRFFFVFLLLFIRNINLYFYFVVAI